MEVLNSLLCIIIISIIVGVVVSLSLLYDYKLSIFHVIYIAIIIMLFIMNVKHGDERIINT